MTNEDVLQIALRQQAYDMNCRPEDFTADRSVVVISAKNEHARKYLELPFFCNLCSYGGHVVASVDARVEAFVREYLESEERATGSAYESFLTPRLHRLTEEFAKYGQLPCFMAEYFLPDMDVLKPLPCDYEIRILTQRDFAGLYLPQWSNALCENRKQLDVLAAAAFDGETMVALAGASADGEEMWQIGVDVLPEYRRRGVASALTSRLACEIVARGKVPFYCCAWANIASARNAIKSGFRPAWAELTTVARERAVKFMG